MDGQDPVSRLEAAAGVAQRAVDGVREDQWGTPSSCAPWAVEDLVRHLVEGNERVAASLAGDGGPVSSGEGRTWSQRHRAAADAVVDGLRRPGALERPLTVPAGTMPGVMVAGLRTVELLVHGWDVATSTGQHLDAPEALVDAAEHFTRQMLERLPAGRRPFHDPTAPPDGATPLDRLAALLGRQVPAAG
jgi:uncharacterized protein (TIGR03086 family)